MAVTVAAAGCQDGPTLGRTNRPFLPRSQGNAGKEITRQPRPLHRFLHGSPLVPQTGLGKLSVPCSPKSHLYHDTSHCPFSSPTSLEVLWPTGDYLFSPFYANAVKIIIPYITTFRWAGQRPWPGHGVTWPRLQV